ncbi:recombination-associated protein RdgC [Alteromonas antoniana]|uniref:recombination-associated protein RdgC n=1 Tax=Alteromonas antoniana TaxID=2803813 RepID=UPI001C4682D9|nr:recombination-associated protein RdgC [Alteromonas antoniana]
MFRNYSIYKLSSPLNLDQIETHLENFRSAEPPKHSLENIGFAPVFPSVANEEKEYCYLLEGAYYFRIQTFTKKIPPALIKYKLDEKIKDVEARNNGEPVSKKMHSELKSEIIRYLASLTPATPSSVLMMYDKKTQCIVIDASADKKAETCLALLRKAIGSVPVTPFFKHSIASELTSWCFDPKSTPDEIDILDKGKLHSLGEDASEASFTRQTMDADEVVASKEAGKVIKEILLQFEDLFSFTFCSDGKVKSLKYTDIQQSRFHQSDTGIHASLDASLTLNTESCRSFLNFIEREFSR